MPNDNPFSFGAMITDPNRFVGRRAELEIITARLNGQQPQGSAVVGPRRIGKSSLLHYLYQPRADETVRASANQQVIYLSAADGNCSTPDAFRLTLARALLAGQPADRRTSKGRQQAELTTQLDNGALCTWETVRTVLTLLSLHPVICLDEFEALLGDAFDNRFFDALRNWANEGLLTWITASAQSLDNLGRQYNHTSPFFNLLATVPLSAFTDTEATILLDQANAMPYSFTPQEQRMLHRLAGNHPYHLQIVAWKLWEEKAHNRTPSRQVLTAFLCQQPNPPTHCLPRPPLHSGWKAAIGFGGLALLLLGMIIWHDPVWVRGLVHTAWTALQNLANILSPYWSTIGNFGGTLQGWGIVLAILLIFWRRKPLREMLCQLWEKITP